MFNKCVLETDGYRAVFELKSIDANKENFDLVVEFQTEPRLRNFFVRSEPTFIAIKDLQRLIIYFDRHIASLKQEPNSESYVFLDDGLGFQLQASAGDIFSDNEGEFGLSVMVNIGKYSKECSRTYIGGRARVTLENIRDFISSIQATLTELSNWKNS